MILYLIILISSIYVCKSLKNPTYSQLTQFPIYEGNDFVLTVKATNYILPLHTFILFRCIKDGKVCEERAINPGFLPGLPTRLNGDYFMILNYTVENNLMNTIFRFYKKADGSKLEIIYLETNSGKLRKEVVKDVAKYPQYKLGSINVKLLLHWKLEFVQRTLDHREGALIANHDNILVCKAVEGFPFSQVKLTGIDKLDGKKLENSDIDNEARFTFVSKIGDHMKKVGCMAGNDTIEDTIKIFHHPTELELIPPVFGYVRNGTNILCRSKNGYPSPTVRWVWVSGPVNSQQYFSLSFESKILNIDKAAPLGSKWIFECISSNSIPNSKNGGKIETVKFIIGEKPIPYFLICAIVLGTILLIICLTVASILIRRRKSRSTVKNHSRSNSSAIFVPDTNDDSSIDKTLLEKQYGPVDEV